MNCDKKGGTPLADGATANFSYTIQKKLQENVDLEVMDVAAMFIQVRVAI